MAAWHRAADPDERQGCAGSDRNCSRRLARCTSEAEAGPWVSSSIWWPQASADKADFKHRNTGYGLSNSFAFDNFSGWSRPRHPMRRPIFATPLHDAGEREPMARPSMRLRHPAPDANRQVRAGKIQQDHRSVRRTSFDRAPIVHPSRHRTQRRDLLDLARQFFLGRLEIVSALHGKP
jgi:hypothetical protein